MKTKNKQKKNMQLIVDLFRACLNKIEFLNSILPLKIKAPFKLIITEFELQISKIFDLIRSDSIKLDQIRS